LEWWIEFRLDLNQGKITDRIDCGDARVNDLDVTIGRVLVVPLN